MPQKSTIYINVCYRIRMGILVNQTLDAGDAGLGQFSNPYSSLGVRQAGWG